MLIGYRSRHEDQLAAAGLRRQAVRKSLRAIVMLLALVVLLVIGREAHEWAMRRPWPIPARTAQADFTHLMGSLSNNAQLEKASILYLPEGPPYWRFYCFRIHGMSHEEFYELLCATWARAPYHRVVLQSVKDAREFGEMPGTPAWFRPSALAEAKYFALEAGAPSGDVWTLPRSALPPSSPATEEYRQQHWVALAEDGVGYLCELSPSTWPREPYSIDRSGRHGR